MIKKRMEQLRLEIHKLLPKYKQKKVRKRKKNIVRFEKKQL